MQEEAGTKDPINQLLKKDREFAQLEQDVQKPLPGKKAKPKGTYEAAKKARDEKEKQLNARKEKLTEIVEEAVKDLLSAGEGSLLNKVQMAKDGGSTDNDEGHIQGAIQKLDSVIADFAEFGPDVKSAVAR